MSYDIPVTVGLEPIKGVASVVAAIAGLSKGMESAFKYADAIRSRRTFEIMGGDLVAMRKASHFVVADTELMALYSKLASQGYAGMAEKLSVVAGKFKTLGIDTETIMNVISGGRLGSLRQWIPPGAQASLKAARTEQQRILILLRATNGEILKDITSYNTLTDSLERAQVALKNFTLGARGLFLKTIGAGAVALAGLWGAPLLLRIVKGKAKLLVGSFMKEWRAGILAARLSMGMGGGAGRNLMAGLLGFGGATKIFPFVSWFAGIGVLRGLLKGLHVDLGATLDMLVRFVGGLDFSNKKFLVSKQLYQQIKNAGLVKFFQLVGKAILFATSAGEAFVKYFEWVGRGLAAFIVPFGALFGYTLNLGSKNLALWSGKMLGGSIAALFMAQSVLKLAGAMKALPLFAMVALLVTAGNMWVDLADKMGGWSKVWEGIVELVKWGGEAALRFFKDMVNQMVNGLNMVVDGLNSVWVALASIGTLGLVNIPNIPHIPTPFSTGVEEAAGAGAASGMTQQQLEAQYNNARATIDKLNAASADKKAKEGDTNISVHIDGDQIDQVRHMRDRKETSKGLGVRTGVHP